MNQPLVIDLPPQDLRWNLLQTLRQHLYEDWKRTATKPDDPGWHACTCGWEGYWSDFQPHVADHLLATVEEAEEASG